MTGFPLFLGVREWRGFCIIGVVMAEYLKRAGATVAGGGGADGDDAVRARVSGILGAVEKGGEDAARGFARELDGWEGDIVVSAEQRENAARAVSEREREDIAFVRGQVCAFAKWQKEQMREGKTVLPSGVVCGQKHIPVSCAGCYVPGGRYAHIASAVMSAATAKIAGAETVVAASPPRAEFGGMHPAVLHALDLCGADVILNLGGAHAIAALAFGLFSGKKADIVAGPGNQYVAEAKRALFGKCGIDLFAGPTEILIVADEKADANIVACDLVGQAEHGPNSPAWLISVSRRLAEEVIATVPQLIAKLPEFSRGNAEAAWRDFGEVVFASSREEAAEIADGYAAEHLEAHCEDCEWWLARLRNYGSLFLGEEATVAFGDKAAGPNHILPTRGAAKYTGGLSVAKFMKTVTWQQMTPDAVRSVGVVSARISRAEGMEAHARTADVRLQKYFPGEKFEDGR